MTFTQHAVTLRDSKNLDLTIPNGKTMVILGPSGCGKTTLLKIIAGLIPPDSGEVRYDNVDVKDVPPGERRIGMVFQHYALYPHLNSKTNVLSYFLFKKKTPELDAVAKAKYQRTSELMGVQLTHLLDRKPTRLSGGEKQRVDVPGAAGKSSVVKIGSALRTASRYAAGTCLSTTYVTAPLGVKVTSHTSTSSFRIFSQLSTASAILSSHSCTISLIGSSSASPTEP